MSKSPSETGLKAGGFSKATRAAFPLLALLSLVFLIVRSKYGYCFTDEGYLISLAQRLYMGDALIADEWHGCQNTGALLLPFYALFRLFSPDNEGIMLCFRYVFCVLWWLACLGVSAYLKKLPVIGSKSIAPALVFFYLVLFSPLDNFILSYTSFGLMACIFLCCLLSGIPNTPATCSKSQIFAFSLIWIVLVLSSPFMVLVYFVLLLLAVVAGAREKKQSSPGYFQNLRTLMLRSVLWIAAAAALYLFLFLFSRADLSAILCNIPFVLNDPQHESRNIIKVIVSTPWYVWRDAPVFVTFAVCLFLFALLKNCRKYRLPLFLLCTVLFIAAQLKYSFTLLPDYDAVPKLNSQMMYVGILGLAAFSLTEKRPWKFFLVFNILGWIFAVIQNYTSNTRIMTIAMSLTVTGVCAIPCILILLRELCSQYQGGKVLKNLALLSVSLVICFQLGPELITRVCRANYDAPPFALNAEIQHGSAKGIMTTAQQAAEHDRLYENMSYLLSSVDTSDKKFYSTGGTPHVYLDADLDYGVFSSWNCYFEPEAQTERIENYVEANPEESPDIVFSGSQHDIIPYTTEGFEQIEYNGSYLFIRK